MDTIRPTSGTDFGGHPVLGASVLSSDIDVCARSDFSVSADLPSIYLADSPRSMSLRLNKVSHICFQSLRVGSEKDKPSMPQTF